MLQEDRRGQQNEKQTHIAHHVLFNSPIDCPCSLFVSSLLDLLFSSRSSRSIFAQDRFLTLHNDCYRFFQGNASPPSFDDVSAIEDYYKPSFLNKKEISPEDLVALALYDVIRLNLLSLPVESTPANFSVIDALTLKNYLIKTIFKNEPRVPFFSAQRTIQFITFLQRKNRSNHFFERVYMMLWEAIRLYEERPGDAFQIFFSYFLSLRIGLLSHPTLPDFLHRCKQIKCLPSPVEIGEFPQINTIQAGSEKNDAGGSIQRVDRETIREWGDSFSRSSNSFSSILLSDLFPSFRRINNLNDRITLIPSLGRFIKRDINWMKTNVLSIGDTFYPTNKKNPGFDFMIFLKASFEDTANKTSSPLLPLVLLIECKYSDPFNNVELRSGELNHKLEVLMKPTHKGGYNNDQNQFECGTLTVPWRRVVFVLASAHENVGLMHGTGVSSSSPCLDFDGTILVSDRNALCDFIGSPLDNLGMFLHDLPPLPPPSSSSSLPDSLDP